MINDRDLERFVRTWLADGSNRLPERYLDAALDEISTTPQRRPVWPAWRFFEMNPRTRFGLAAAAVALVLIVGVAILSHYSIFNVGTQSPSPTAAADNIPTLFVAAQERAEVCGAGCFDTVATHVVAIDLARGQQTKLFDLDASSSISLAPNGGRFLVFGTFPGVGNGFTAVGDLASHELWPWAPNAGLFVGGPEMAVLAPRGDRVAAFGYSTADPASTFIALLDVQGRELGQLRLPEGAQLNGEYDGEPWGAPLAWSPDARYLAVVGCRPCSEGTKTQTIVAGHDHLYLLPLDGSPGRELLDWTELFNGLAWGPDGSAIAVGSGNGISLVSVTDSHEQKVTDGGDLAPCWSRDGQRLAFERADPRDGSGLGIWVVGADGTGLTKLTSGDDHAPRWSPDGRWIVFERSVPDAFTNGNTEHTDVWVVPADGGAASLVATYATGGW